MKKILDNKVAIVTGASSGIGRATAILYAKEGAKVIVSDINKQGGKETVEMITNNGGEAFWVYTDVSKPEDNEQLVQETLKKYGRLDIACNNAGIGGEQAPVTEMSGENWEKVIAINLSSVFYGMKHQIAAMLTNGGGAIVNISSILGSVGFANAPAYVAAKHGLVGLTKTTAIDYGKEGIRVNAVGPAFIETPLLSGLDENMKAMLNTLHPIGRLGKPEEVAELILWLSSDKASFATGSYYPIDGAYLAQ